MNGQWSNGIVRVIGIVLLLAVTVSAGGSQIAIGQGDFVASLDPVQGLIQHHAANAGPDDWQTVTTRQQVSEGDAVRTDARGLATLTFFEGVQVEIRPGSQIVVNRLSVTDDTVTFQIGLTMLVGEAIHHVERIVGPESSYEVTTPGASLVVRGTEFFTRVSTVGVTDVSVIEGAVAVIGLNPARVVTGEFVAEAGQTVTISAVGDVVEPGKTSMTLPDRPDEAELALRSCGDGICQPEEEERCIADCAELPNCGDGECNPQEDEDPVTCPADCLPPDVSGEPVNFHWFWAERRCDIDPLPPVRGAVLMQWGVGCFDSAAHANAHPHPADYQLTVDGQAWDMGGLRQTGVYTSDPYCPWSWGFELGPLLLPPGQHTLTLTETITDTWTTLGAGNRGRNAGDVVTLQCEVEVVRGR
ncbi:MAG: FecR domain-containing protein [Anaerolineae bacterium]|nr:FecR domain-containing protein [Anaerolineae bacterium]